MMKFLHGLFELLVFLVVLFEGTLMIYGMSNGGKPYWDMLLRTLQGDKLVVFLGGVSLILLVLLYLLTSGRKRSSSKTISFQGHNGPITISMKAVRDFVLRIGDDFSEILSMQPNLEFSNGALSIEMDVRIQEGAHVPELCQMLQERVTESVQDQLGLRDMKKVRVNVRELVHRAPTATAPVQKKEETILPA